MVGAAIATVQRPPDQAQRLQIGVEKLPEESDQVLVRVIPHDPDVIRRSGAVVGHVQLQHADHVDARVGIRAGNRIGAAQADFLSGVGVKFHGAARFPVRFECDADDLGDGGHARGVVIGARCDLIDTGAAASVDRIQMRAHHHDFIGEVRALQPQDDRRLVAAVAAFLVQPHLDIAPPIGQRLPSIADPQGRIAAQAAAIPAVLEAVGQAVDGRSDIVLVNLRQPRYDGGLVVDGVGAVHRLRDGFRGAVVGKEGFGLGAAGEGEETTATPFLLVHVVRDGLDALGIGARQDQGGSRAAVDRTGVRGDGADPGKGIA